MVSRGGGIGGVETAEKNWVMMGWDGSVVLRGIQGFLAVPYIPVQGSPGVFWESLGVGGRAFVREIIIGGVEIAYMRMSGLLG